MHDSGTTPRLTSGSAVAGWLQRALLATLGLAVLVAAFFFLTIALFAAALVALVIGARLWWGLRRARAEHAASQPLEGQYTVVEDSAASDRLER